VPKKSCRKADDSGEGKDMQSRYEERKSIRKRAIYGFRDPEGKG
jgi:hypothetical protein